MWPTFLLVVAVTYLHEIAHAVAYLLVAGVVAVPLPAITVPLSVLLGQAPPLELGTGDLAAVKVAGPAFEVCLALVLAAVLLARRRNYNLRSDIVVWLAGALGIGVGAFRILEAVGVVLLLRRGSTAPGDLGTIWEKANVSASLLPLAYLLWVVLLLPVAYLWCRDLKARHTRNLYLHGVILGFVGVSLINVLGQLSVWLQSVI